LTALAYFHILKYEWDYIRTQDILEAVTLMAGSANLFSQGTRLPGALPVSRVDPNPAKIIS
jgi:hypothetical protein